MKRGFTCDLRKKKDHKWKPFTQGEGKSAPWEKKKKNHTVQWRKEDYKSDDIQNIKHRNYNFIKCIYLY